MQSVGVVLVLKVASPENIPAEQDKQANLANDALRRMPNGNLAAPLPGMVTDPNNKVLILLFSGCDLNTSLLSCSQCLLSISPDGTTTKSRRSGKNPMQR